MLMSCDRRIWAELFPKTNTVTVSLHDLIRAKYTPAHKETEAKIYIPRGESKKLLNAQNGLNSSKGIVIALIVKTVVAPLGQ